MSQVQQWFEASTVISRNDMVLVVPKGNPKQVKSIEDLARPELRVGLAHPVNSALGALTDDSAEETAAARQGLRPRPEAPDRAHRRRPRPGEPAARRGAGPDRRLPQQRAEQPGKRREVSGHRRDGICPRRGHPALRGGQGLAAQVSHAAAAGGDPLARRRKRSFRQVGLPVDRGRRRRHERRHAGRPAPVHGRRGPAAPATGCFSPASARCWAPTSC